MQLEKMHQFPALQIPQHNTQDVTRTHIHFNSQVPTENRIHAF
jgi:hypothetical protein